MSNFERDPVSVASREVHGPSFGMGTLGLVAVLGLGAGTILGGVIMPFLRSSPPDQSQTEKLEAAQETNRALLFSMYPQTIYAPVRQGSEAVSTDMSVEQYLTELEVRASQAGLSASKSVERKGEIVEISYVFSEKGDENSRAFPQSKIKIAHVKTLVLTFVSGPLPGTIALQKARADGRDRSAGANFVDFVSLGATPPQLGEGEFLTARGVFEIKLTGTGVGAFLDGVLVYPVPPQRPGPALAFPGSTPPSPNAATNLPRRLALQSFQPAVGTLKNRLILVASSTPTDSCAAKVIILDAKRGTVIELPEPLETPAVSVTNAKGALILNGFCVPENVATPQLLGDTSTSKEPVALAPKVQVRLSARYDLATGALSWQRETIAMPPPTPVSAVDATSQTGASTPWRAQSDTRLASPISAGGALVSVACRPGGGVTIALSGLPAPADGLASGMRFTAGGGSAIAQMRWRASAGGYELDGTSRPNEARAILERLRSGGTMTISGAGASKTVPAPGSAQIDQLVRRCGTGATTASAPVVPADRVVAQAPAKASAPKPKPKVSATGVESKSKPTPKPVPKPVPNPTASTQPKSVVRPSVPKAAAPPRATTPAFQPRPEPRPDPRPEPANPAPKPKPASEASPPR